MPSAPCLKTKDLVPIRIEEHRGRLDLEVTTEKLKRKELMHFSRQLAVFVRSGIPILDALDTIAEEAQDRVLRKVIVSMTDQLRQGSTFSAAARVAPRSLPALLPRRARIGRAHRQPRRDPRQARRATSTVTCRRDPASPRRLMYPSVVVVLVDRHGGDPRRLRAARSSRISSPNSAPTCRSPPRCPARVRQPLHRPVVHPGRRGRSRSSIGVGTSRRRRASRPATG